MEWNYLQKVMEVMDFKSNLIGLIMQYLSVTPSRGLRQGNPLSPYLFLLYKEGLISLLSTQNNEHYIQGIRVCHGAPSINHLLFAEDSVIFCEASEEANIKLQALLGKYEEASG